MASKVLTLAFLISLASLPSLLLSQQLYEGLASTDCQSSSTLTTATLTTVLGYLCNGPSFSCQAYLTFHSQPPYQTPSTISALLGSDPSQLSLLNSVSNDATFPRNTKVIVPINCSCSDGHYQANVSHTIQHGDTFFIIANNTYQGLSTCQALQAQNPDHPATSLVPGTNITVPLRCACPTSNQTSNGVRFLLSYLVDSGDTVFIISQKFGVTQQRILEANGLTLASPNINPFTTLLIPLENKPNNSQTIAPPPPPPPPFSPPPAGKSEGHTWVYVVIGIGVGICVMVATLALLWVFLRNKRRNSHLALHAHESEKNAKPEGKSSRTYEDMESSEGPLLGIDATGHGLKVYKFEELQHATKNFSDECRIVGSVYRGVINGDVAAVKKMNRDVSNEIEVLKKTHHFNLIRLSGVCFKQGYWFLVYEYAQNGSLSQWIFDRSGSTVLSWGQRVQIALDVADGLNYLHGYIDPPYVHMDIKSSNILLDENFRVKIANLALSRPVGGKEYEFVLTRHIVGTKGYMAPEYLEHGLVSPKVDVYAFGVVMMELITGTDVIDVLSLEAFQGAIREEDAGERLGTFIDPLLEGNYPLDLALIMSRLIEACLRWGAGSRPSMGEISQSLSKLCEASLSWGLSNSVPESRGFSSEADLHAKKGTL